MRERIWLVGERMTSPSHLSSAAEPRSARLEARLALYAQYATLVADEVEAAWSGDPDRARTVPRTLAQQRAELAERYEALKAESGANAESEVFGSVLAEAVTELDYHAHLDQSLRDRLHGLHHGRLLLPAGAEVVPDGEQDAGQTALLPDVDGSPIGLVPAGDEPATGAEDDEGDAPLPLGIEGALVTARSRGVGGVLAGQFPGIVAGAVPARVRVTPHEHDHEIEDGADGAVPRARVDLRF